MAKFKVSFMTLTLEGKKDEVQAKLNKAYEDHKSFLDSLPNEINLVFNESFIPIIQFFPPNGEDYRMEEYKRKIHTIVDEALKK